MINEQVNANLIFRFDHDLYSVRNLDLPRSLYKQLTSGEPLRGYKSWEMLEEMSVVGTQGTDDLYILAKDGNGFALYRHPLTPGLLDAYKNEGTSYHGSLESVLETLDPKDTEIHIMWDDLRPETQARILRMLGDNGNFDVFPMHTVYAPEEILSMDLS